MQDPFNVVRIAFALINKLRQVGVQEYLINELEIMGEINFAFSQPTQAKVTSNELAKTLDAWDEEASL